MTGFFLASCHTPGPHQGEVGCGALNCAQRDVWPVQGASCGVSPGSLLLLWCLRGWIGLASLANACVSDLLQDLLGLPTKGTGALYR